MHRKWSVRWCTYIDFTHEIIIGIERIDGAPQNDLHGNKTWMVQPITTIETVFLNSCVFHKTKTQPVIQIELFTADLLLSLKRCGGLLSLFAAGHCAWMVGTGGRVGAIKKVGPGVYERCIQNTCMFERLGDAVDRKSDRTAFVAIVLVKIVPRYRFARFNAESRSAVCSVLTPIENALFFFFQGNILMVQFNFFGRSLR